MNGPSEWEDHSNLSPSLKHDGRTLADNSFLPELLALRKAARTNQSRALDAGTNDDLEPPSDAPAARKKAKTKKTTKASASAAVDARPLAAAAPLPQAKMELSAILGGALAGASFHSWTTLDVVFGVLWSVISCSRLALMERAGGICPRNMISRPFTICGYGADGAPVTFGNGLKTRIFPRSSAAHDRRRRRRQSGDGSSASLPRLASSASPSRGELLYHRAACSCARSART